MLHPFQILEPEYNALIERAVILPSKAAVLRRTALRLLKDINVYKTLSSRTSNRIPAIFIMALAEREMSGDLHCYLGNGQSLSKKTTIVPIGRGPFLQEWPENFYAGALDAFHVDGLENVQNWSLARACYESESYNGWGYRDYHKIPSPYVFGGTSVQRPGKYVQDGKFDAAVMDPQLGTLAIMEAIADVAPEFKFWNDVTKVKGSTIAITPAPVGVGGGLSVKELQQKLNERGAQPPLLVDGIYGKKTRQAIFQFQQTHGLEVDGLVGPKTMAALGIGVRK